MKTLVRNIAFIMKTAWRNNRHYIWFSLLKIMSDSAAPFLIIVLPKLLIDSIAEQRPLKNIFIIIFLIVLLKLIINNLQTIGSGNAKLYAKNMMVVLAEEFSRKAVEMDYEDTENPLVQDKVYRASFILLNSDNLEIYLNAINEIVISIIQLVVTFFIVSSLSIYIVLLLAGIAVVNFLVSTVVQNKNYKIFQWIMKLERIWRYFIDVSIQYKYGKPVRIYELKDKLLEKSFENRKEHEKVFGKSVRNTFLNSLFVQVTSIIQEAVLFFVLIMKTINNVISIGDFVLYYNSSKELSKSINTVVTRMIELYRNNRYINDYVEYIQRESKMHQNDKDAIAVSQIKKGDICLELKDVSFRYPNAKEYTLKHINLKVRTGEKISIVGENGSGKTTLVKLIMRLYDVTDGEILWFGTNIKEIQYDEYLRQFSTVFQDFKIFGVSIYENICFQDQDDQKKMEIDSILKENGLQEKISTYPNKGETILTKQFDQDGLEMSIGEQQLLALSRAMYKKGELFILDEPTSSLSPIAEYEIYSGFNRIVKDKTTIYISHRLSSSMFCDHIVVLENGTIAEYGTNQELMDLHGLYASMYEMQSKYYKKGRGLSEEDE